MNHPDLNSDERIAIADESFQDDHDEKAARAEERALQTCPTCGDTFRGRDDRFCPKCHAKTSSPIGKQAVPTPGPWHVSPRGLSVSALTDPTARVCIVIADDLNDEVACANGRLIAAAPDLVECLQKTALCLDDMERANALLNRDTMAATCLVISNEIRNALAKAGL